MKWLSPSTERVRRALFGALSLVFLGAGLPKSATAEPPLAGLLLERVNAPSLLVDAGLRSGDLLLSWEGETAGLRGELRSPFDWSWLRLEVAPRERLRVVGFRLGSRRIFEIDPGSWTRTDSEVRPTMPPEILAVYLEGKTHADAGDLELALSFWETAAELARPLDSDVFQCWIHLRMARTWTRVADGPTARDRADGAFKAALGRAESPLQKAVVLVHRAAWLRSRTEYARAEQEYRSALRLWQENWGETAGLAGLRLSVATLARRQGDLETAEELGQSALELYRSTAPGSLFHASSLNHLGILASMKGDQERAARLIEEALAIQMRLAPQSLDTASYLNNLGNIAEIADDLDRAAAYLSRALEIKEKTSPDSHTLAGTLNNLAMVASKRGDLVLAESYLERALAIQEKRSPGSISLARILHNLGMLNSLRGDSDRARDYARRALDLQTKLAPESVDVAMSLSNLGLLEHRLGRSERGREYLARALDLNGKMAPDSLTLAENLAQVGGIAWGSGDHERAWDYLEDARAMLTRLAPQGLTMSNVLGYMGRLSLAEGDAERAAGFQQRALEIRRRWAPHSFLTAESLNDLGAIRRHQGRSEEAVELFLSALDALEAQIGTLGGTHDHRGRYRARYGGFYRDAVELLLELDRPGDAFGVVERSRARSFLAMMVERDLIFELDVPEELERSRRRVAVRYDAVQRDIASLPQKSDPAVLETLLGELSRLRREREEIAVKVRRASPRLADLTYPRPFDVEAAVAALDPGTVLLSYSLGETRSDLFVLSDRGELDVLRLEVGREELSREVQLFRRLVEEGRSGASVVRGTAVSLERSGRRLYRRLIAPAEGRLAVAHRLLILPDGPLYSLPFAALVREPALDGPSGPRYLVEWKPLHSALSATVYGELLAKRRASDLSTTEWVAFGDPRYRRDFPGAEASAPELVVDERLRSAFDRGFDLMSLPSTRREVEGIAQLFSPRNRRVYLGEDATEARAKTSGKDARYLHFATHGVLDPQVPLDSGLVFSLPESRSVSGDNGFLQAWEIFESVRLSSDLVVLSACGTGLGRLQGGEGLIGLTRAFQYAGAGTVASTLWNVEDRATAELMVRFYRHLQAGLAKDEALRAAQIELIRAPIEIPTSAGHVERLDATAPFYWAAFQIYGDWR